jgi:molybdopterin-guanine dinucleotide biosynthesis protein A
MSHRIGKIEADMPLVEPQQLIWVVEQLAAKPQCQGVMCCRNENGQNLIEPFPSAFRGTAAELIRQRMSAGRRSLHGLCELPEFCAASAPGDWPARTWTNLNDPQQLAAFVAREVK